MFRLTAAVLLFLEMVVAPAVMLYENKQQRKRAVELDYRESLLVDEERQLCRYHESLLNLNVDIERRERRLEERERKVMAMTFDESKAADGPPEPYTHLPALKFDAQEAIVPQRITIDAYP